MRKCVESGNNGNSDQFCTDSALYVVDTGAAVDFISSPHFKSHIDEHRRGVVGAWWRVSWQHSVPSVASEGGDVGGGSLRPSKHPKVTR